MTETERKLFTHADNLTQLIDAYLRGVGPVTEIDISRMLATAFSATLYKLRGKLCIATTNAIACTLEEIINEETMH